MSALSPPSVAYTTRCGGSIRITARGRTTTEGAPLVGVVVRVDPSPVDPTAPPQWSKVSAMVTPLPDGSYAPLPPTLHGVAVEHLTADDRARLECVLIEWCAQRMDAPDAHAAVDDYLHARAAAIPRTTSYAATGGRS